MKPIQLQQLILSAQQTIQLYSQVVHEESYPCAPFLFEYFTLFDANLCTISLKYTVKEKFNFKKADHLSEKESAAFSFPSPDLPNCS